MLEIDWTIVLVIINFIILVILMGAFLYGPLMKFLDDRSASIQADIDTAEESKLGAEKVLEEVRAELQKAKAEGRKIIDDANENSREEHKKIIQEANTAKEEILSESQLQTTAMVKQAKDELKKDVIIIASEIAEKLIKDNIATIDQEKIVNDYLAKWS